MIFIIAGILILVVVGLSVAINNFMAGLPVFSTLASWAWFLLPTGIALAVFQLTRMLDKVGLIITAVVWLLFVFLFNFVWVI